ncbi:hypothetical protein F511_47491 [Dorcoceras hygrometricum]|uniref:Uncharacterized protein n=1 Tax=Dorcoceras hygrometricum TaxID=472368 RepID=A0A2Z6ZQW7_9LAMI|nr:hypothetical protein F511_47491 [Dorcoceras hygrometricum]
MRREGGVDFGGAVEDQPHWKSLSWTREPRKPYNDSESSVRGGMLFLLGFDVQCSHTKIKDLSGVIRSKKSKIS